MDAKNKKETGKEPPIALQKSVSLPLVDNSFLNVLHSLLSLQTNGGGWTSLTKNSASAASRNSMHGEKLFKSTFGTIMFAQRWQKTLSAEKKANIVEHFKNPRDDPYDVYKPNSKIATQTLIETPMSKPMSASASEMLHEIAINYDFCVPLDIVENYRPNTFISHESQEQIDRLPSWLRFLVLLKYDSIHKVHQHQSHQYLRHLANQVDSKKSVPFEMIEEKNEEDVLDAFEIYTHFYVKESEIESVVKQKRVEQFVDDDLFRLKCTLSKWAVPKTWEEDWAPESIHKAASLLRRALLTSPSAAELSMVEEDEKFKRDEAHANTYHNNNDDNTIEGAWEDIITDKVGFREEVAKLVEEDLKSIPMRLTKAEREQEKFCMKQVEDRDAKIKEEQKKKRKEFWEGIQNHELLRRRRAKKETKIHLSDRSLFRRYSRTWYKNCPQERIKQAKRLPHHYRLDGGFHAYCVALISSTFFKMFIMIIIILNAITLAVDDHNTRQYKILVYIFEIMDNIFLSVYLVEFLIKIYAHPYKYWLSGFNVFDFFILIVSLFKQILDWSGAREISILKVLVIIRALRILRGISFSVQIQVLIAALIITIKTHVLSVLILLFLLMYIVAILAYFFFKDLDIPNNPWSNIFSGMLRLFSFVTMDGWTTTSDEFEDVDQKHTGRTFCLINIVVGNFIISNIFIAIIIMQISEATEEFRTRQRDEREEIISRKKEIVFRRQKLDMRQLLAKQAVSVNADFQYLGSQFLRLLRHDDLVDMNSVPFSPLWMDALYKTTKRCNHTANLLMNLHRQMADNLLQVYHQNNENKYNMIPIRRGRYNQCMKFKAKLALLRQEFFRHDPNALKVNRPLRFRNDKNPSNLNN